LTGKHETASITQFSYGVANRGCSIRIPRETLAKGYGYFEDRRPASNVDPYVATAKIVDTITADFIPPSSALTLVHQLKQKQSPRGRQTSGFRA